jgi:hypothetical protein
VGRAQIPVSLDLEPEGYECVKPNAHSLEARSLFGQRHLETPADA